MDSKVISLPGLRLRRSRKEAKMVIVYGSHMYASFATCVLRLPAVQPAWTVDANIPLSKEEIEDVLIDLANKFGFQKGELPFQAA